MAHESPARITRVVLKNYKSIVSCDVELRPLTLLVGPNGSGKSNFVDAKPSPLRCVPMWATK